jgi:hypothetical protein
LLAIPNFISHFLTHYFNVKLPPELGNARFLQLMYIDSNDLEGTCIERCTSVQHGIPVNNLILLLAFVFLSASGVIDGDLFSKLPLLLEVQLYDNQFSGKIPSELGQLELLGLFYADGNLLTGMYHPTRLAKTRKHFSSELS